MREAVDPPESPRASSDSPERESRSVVSTIVVDPADRTAPAIGQAGDAVRVLAVSCGPNGDLHVASLNGVEAGPVTREVLPADLLGVIALSDAAQSGLERLRSSVSWGREVRIERLDGGDPGALGRWIIGALNDRRATLSRQLVDMTRQLSLFREQHHEVQRAFMQLEAVAFEQGSPRQAVAFVNEPVEALPAEGGFSQRLPVDAVGLGGVELHFASLPKTTSGELTLTLEDAFDQRLARWIVEYDDLREGWNLFSVERPVSGSSRSARLTARFVARSEAVPLLSFGAPQPVLEFRAHGPASSVWERGLALRLWRGLPGVRSAQTISAIMPEGASGLRRYRFPLDSLRQAEPVGTLPDVGFPLVAPVDHGLRTNPLPDRPVIVRLADRLPEGVKHLRAFVRTSHASASTLDYAIAVAADEREALRRIGADAGVVRQGFSGWIPVEPLTDAEVNLFTSESVSGDDRVYLAVRPSAGGDWAFGWADWLGLEASTGLAVA